MNHIWPLRVYICINACGIYGNVYMGSGVKNIGGNGICREVGLQADTGPTEFIPSHLENPNNTIHPPVKKMQDTNDGLKSVGPVSA